MRDANYVKTLSEAQLLFSRQNLEDYHEHQQRPQNNPIRTYRTHDIKFDVKPIERFWIIRVCVLNHWWTKIVIILFTVLFDMQMFQNGVVYRILNLYDLSITRCREESRLEEVDILQGPIVV